MTDKEYFELWHLAQKLRDMYDPNYLPKVTIEVPAAGLLYSPPPYAVVNHDDKRPIIRAIIRNFLDEYNRRHETPITVDDYLEEKEDDHEAL